jgi:hypothetical protein
MIVDCLHDLTALGVGEFAGLVAALFVAGLVAGATHCAMMCAPFVLAQAAATAPNTAAGGRLRRLSGAALLPYQAGRMLGYALLGAVAGGFAGAVGRAAGELRLLAAGLLMVAAMAMLAQAAPRLAAWLPRGWAPRPPQALMRMAAPLLAAPAGGRGVLLGLLLSALPCGALYGALAGAAASGSALGGALGMAAFVAGTAPPLTGVALLGRLFGRRRGPAIQLVGGVLLGANATVLVAFAVRLAAGA